jgi:hypothetical protein
MDELKFAAAVVATVVVITLYLCSLRYIFQFPVEHGVIVIKLFGFMPVRRVPVSDIEKAEIVTWRSFLPGRGSDWIGYLFAERWSGYLSWRGLGIKQQHGLSRWLVKSVRKIRNACVNL